MRRIRWESMGHNPEGVDPIPILKGRRTVWFLRDLDILAACKMEVGVLCVRRVEGTLIYSVEPKEIDDELIRAIETIILLTYEKKGAA